MIKKLLILFASGKIKWHWWFIRKERKKGNSLIAKGYPLSSSKMLQLNKNLSRHSCEVIKAENNILKWSGQDNEQASFTDFKMVSISYFE